MLLYQNIHTVLAAQGRLGRKVDYEYWPNQSHSRDADRMVVFTIGAKADADAASNLAYLLDLGRRHNCAYLMLDAHKVQFLAKQIQNNIEQEMVPSAWRKEYLAWCGKEYRLGLEFCIEDSGQGVLHYFLPVRRVFATKNTRGFYDIASGIKLTNRRKIIECIWEYGFTTRRGRPVSVGSIELSGSTRQELEALRSKEPPYNWPRKALSRYYTWPGAW